MTPHSDVLVVDDEPVVTDAIRMVLTHAGLTVTTVGDAESALVHPDLDHCRLVICDLMLPGRSGFEALLAMRARRPKLPIVMMTGYATPGHEDQVLAAGATAFLPKPFDETELLTLVRHVLAQADVAGEEPTP
jgi:two-component system, OmpR family, response regulator